MKVEARIKFYDTENNKQLRKKGEQFEVSAERGKYEGSNRSTSHKENSHRKTNRTTE